jgi:protein SCO1/2
MLMPSTPRNAVAAAALAAAFALSPAAAHDDHARHGPAQAVAPQGARINLTETPLLDQDGRSVRLKSDVIGDRIAIVGFIYTSCTTVCPVISAMFAQTEAKLGLRAGRDVKLVTVTVDPVRDTPARLKEHGRQHGAGPGWTLVTGAKPQVDEALKVFGAYTPNFTDHPPIVYVGDAKLGKWVRFYGFPSPDQLMSAVGELTAARKAAAAG